MIIFEKVNKSFGKLQVLKNFSIEIKQSEVLVVLGPSGCGKTTFLRCINKLENIDSGKIFVNSVDITSKHTNMRSVRQEIGFVFQQFNLFPHMTVLDNIILAPIKVKKMEKQAAITLAEELLYKVGILDKAYYYPDQISSGQKQRVAIARSLAMNPMIMLLDEPTSALDPQMTNEVLEVIIKLVNEGMTMVIVTHEMNFARDVANRVIFMEGGTILEDAPPNEFFENTKDPRIITFLQSEYT